MSDSDEAPRRRKEDDEALRQVLSTQEGRRVMWGLIDSRGGAFRRSYSGEQTHRAAYLEGRRSVALELVAECQRVSAPNYVRMSVEAVERRERERQKRQRTKAQEKSDGG